jgi:hypothetical protein
VSLGSYGGDVRVTLRWQAKLRTTLPGLDPGLDQPRLAAIVTASMVLAVMSGVRALTGQPE